MLQKIRDRSGSLIIKVILSIIGASFVVFGIADIVRIITATPPVVKMGKVKISFQEFYTKYQSHLAHLKREEKTITKDLLEQLPTEILQNLINTQIMVHEPNRLGILAPQSIVTLYIQSIPAFQKNNSFDEETFRNTVQYIGLSPRAFITNIEQEIKQQQFLQPLISGIRLNTPYMDFLMNIIYCKKNFEIIMAPELTSKKLEPSDKALEKWVKRHHDQYIMPAQRNIDIILLDHKILEEGLPLEKEELEKAYQDKKEEWTIPEQREVYTLEFKSESDALDAKKLFSDKISIEKIKKSIPGVDFKRIENTDIPSNIAPIVFNLVEGDSYGPVSVNGQWVIYAVIKFIPAQVKKFEDVSSEIENDIRKSKLNLKIDNIKDQIEDGFASGQSFEEMAQKFPLKRLSISGITEENIREKLIEKGLEEEVVKNISTQIFNLEKGEDSPFFDIAHQSYILCIRDIKEKHLPDLEEIKPQVKADWIKNEKQKKAFEWYSSKFGSVDSAKTWNEIIKKDSFKVQKFSISRFDIMTKTPEISKIFDTTTLDRLMLLKKNSVEFLETSDEKIAIVFVKGSKPDMTRVLDNQKINIQEKIQKALLEGVSSDSILLIRDSIKNTYTIKINKKSVDKIIQHQNDD